MKTKITDAIIRPSPAFEGAENLPDAEFKVLRAKIDKAWSDNAVIIDVGESVISTFTKRA